MREGCDHRHKNDDDDITCKMQVGAPTFNDVNDPWIFSDWLAIMDYYFDQYKMLDKRKF